MNPPQIYLASQSPRRRELLQQIGICFDVVQVDINEDRQSAEAPVQLVERLALDKARAGWRQRGQQGVPVMGADTIVVLAGDILGKPADRDAAEAMLARLSGQTHEVMTAVALVNAEQQGLRLSVSHVTFRQTSLAERQAYCATGEPDDKAGGYAIQGHAAVFIENLQGSYSGVMGLPLFETADLLREFAIPVI